MIRYSITLTDLQDRITQRKSNWLSRAAARTTLFESTGGYLEPPQPFWGEIKDVYRTLQNNKCAYCERKMGGQRRGRVDFDVEHFRPKRGVELWPKGELLAALNYRFPTGNEFAEGYYLLAYHPLNYAAACKICNSSLKSNYFPIAGSRITGAGTPTTLVAELPLLIYPIGDMDSDPETLIRFDGSVPLPVSMDENGHDYRRARVTIDFFELAIREELQRERSATIFGLWQAIQLENHPKPLIQQQSRQAITILQSVGSQHSSCARCYVKLCRDDLDKAEQIAEAALSYLESLR